MLNGDAEFAEREASGPFHVQHLADDPVVIRVEERLVEKVTQLLVLCDRLVEAVALLFLTRSPFAGVGRVGPPSPRADEVLVSRIEFSEVRPLLLVVEANMGHDETLVVWIGGIIRHDSPHHTTDKLMYGDKER